MHSCFFLIWSGLLNYVQFTTGAELGNIFAHTKGQKDVELIAYQFRNTELLAKF